MIERLERRPAARALECPHAPLEVRGVGRGGEVLVVPAQGSAPAPESLNDAIPFRLDRVAATRSTLIHSSAPCEFIRDRTAGSVRAGDLHMADVSRVRAITRRVLRRSAC
jgi:hypothetical protein